ncbi:protein rep [Pantanalinema sp. GBBB05]|uniref:protein rep n=1 Tax=Pantanalinema sp. GBBB05 TaxID=2604139 RepID=UPI001DD856A2|nr:replication protein [Pantanalinema sp. GBBB05]
MSSIAPESAGSNSQAPSLSEVSPRDKPWDKHRAFADKVEGFYRSSSEFQGYGEKIHDCADLLRFGLQLSDNDAVKLKLRSARFCRLRHCPVCQWRRSLRWKAKAYKVLPRIVTTHPRHRWLFVTLTQKNVPITKLRETLIHMNASFARLVKLKAFPAEGWLRSTEVTRGKDGSAHPHFHCLLLVSPNYFSGRNYLKQAKWVEMWQKSARLDYNPILDVRSVREGSKPMELVPELLKYCTKESDLVADKEWFLELTRQMHGMKGVATGGLLKEYLRELEEEPDDLIGSDFDDIGTDELSVYFGWNRKSKKYKFIDS